ncbi:polysaccharide deacetylase family protein [Empedobacter brevis]|uniref:polysaccharide deacetylase family protein n=1 Tax=Empedobacter brevis TaxID=247 RepID=UPI0039B012B9
MNSEIIIFTEKITNRINYIFDFIFINFSGINYKITTDFNEFIQTNSPKINFSNQLLENEINFKVDELLLETNIQKNINYSTLTEIGKCFYWLSRYEEYIAKPHQFDKHNRFLGSDLDYSIPIVDKICLEIQEKIKTKFPDISLKKRIYKQINTHDVDYAWKYLYHSPKIKYGSLLKKLLKADFKEFLNQIKILNHQEKDPYDTFDYLKDLAEKHQIETIFFWLLGDYSTFDKNHHWKNNEQKKLIREISTWAEIGIHPSYQSNYEGNKLPTELNRLEKIINKPVKKSRQHFIKLNFPNTYQQLLINGILEDYTMGFSHQLGFRAGTSTPFNWFDLTINQQTLLTIFPFVAMDVTLKNYLNLSPQQSIEEIKRLKQTIKEVNGTFITLFHQSNLNGDWKDWRKVYESIFE